MEKNEIKPGPVAKAAEISIPYLSQIINGRRRPSPDVAKRISDAIGINVLAILYPEDARRDIDAEVSERNHDESTNSIITTGQQTQLVAFRNHWKPPMTVKDKARQLFFFMRSLDFEDLAILRCIFSLFNISIHDVAIQAGVSEQFVRQFLAGKKSSEKVAAAVTEMLFGDGSGIDLKL